MINKQQSLIKTSLGIIYYEFNSQKLEPTTFCSTERRSLQISKKSTGKKTKSLKYSRLSELHQKIVFSYKTNTFSGTVKTKETNLFCLKPSMKIAKI